MILKTAIICLFLMTNAAQACRQALILGLDVSGSVNQREYRLQKDGLAATLLDEEVAELLLIAPDSPVTLAVFEWSAREYQSMIVPWTPVTSAAALAEIAERLRATQRKRTPFSTGICSAMLFAHTAFQAVPTCAVRTLDLSGDGKSNSGLSPRRIHQTNQMAGITVNALVIGAEKPKSPFEPGDSLAELESYFKNEVIYGPGAFTETAHGYSDFAAAMKRKLLRELAIAVASR